MRLHRQSAPWVAASTSPQLPSDLAGDGQYGYLWWVLDASSVGVGGFAAFGAWCQTVQVWPGRRVVVVTTGNDTKLGSDDLCDAVGPILQDAVVDPLR